MVYLIEPSGKSLEKVDHGEAAHLIREGWKVATEKDKRKARLRNALH